MMMVAGSPTSPPERGPQVGWTFFHRDKGQTTADVLAGELLGASGEYGEFLAHGMSGGTFYAAYRLGKAHGANEGRVIGLAILTQWDPHNYFNWGYKVQDETMGPYATEAPARVLDLLTSTDNECALEWRAACRANLARKASAGNVKAGTVVEFAAPINFTDGVSESRFRFEARSKFIRISDGRRVNITNWRKRADWTVAASEQEVAA